ncbi:MAG: PilZ domain-containing protein [Oligoflexales bacterium]
MVGLRKNTKKQENIKDVRLRFCNLKAREKKAITEFIAINISKDAGTADKKFDPNSPKEKRRDIRVVLSRFEVSVHADAGPTLEAQDFKGQLTDLSTGGCCIRVAQDVKLTKNSKAKISLEFILPGFSPDVEILGLRYDD